MALAQQTGAVLISADSRQVYRHFDIGTAKPTVAERTLVAHEGIDLIEPTERFSAAAWADAAQHWIADAAGAGRPVIVVGGTGFYIRALTEPLFEAPHVDAEARDVVLAALESQSTETLRARCEVYDPARAHLGRTQLLRAVETYELTGRPLSAWLAERSRSSELVGSYLLVDPGAVLRDRIAARVEQMLAAGWEAEVERLTASVPETAPAWNACGYDLIRRMQHGEIPRGTAIERTIIATRQYAKRQRTWFRHQLPLEHVTTMNPDAVDAPQRALDWFGRVQQMEAW
jgi:tRNA dimethylallyltransferase